jgi:hypothetical protein
LAEEQKPTDVTPEVAMGQGRVFDLKRVATFALLVGALTGATACASGGGVRSNSSPNEITREDIAANPDASTAMDLVRRIRPRWVTTSRTRTFGSGGADVEPVVVLDGVRFGSADSLTQINLINVIRIRYLNSNDATTLYGTGYMGGAIQVFTR